MRLSFWPQSLFGRLIAALVDCRRAGPGGEPVSLCARSRALRRRQQRAGVVAADHRDHAASRATFAGATRRVGRDAEGAAGESRAVAEAARPRVPGSPMGRPAAAAAWSGRPAERRAARRSPPAAGPPPAMPPPQPGYRLPLGPGGVSSRASGASRAELSSGRGSSSSCRSPRMCRAS